jgi:large subunit ribosomal protein L10e
MALRKASAYSKKIVRPYTRKSGKKKKAFIKAIPQIKIAKYNMGDRKSSDAGKHAFTVILYAEEKVQIRDNALEACRMAVNKALDKAVPGEYYFIVKVYPHHILRENKIAAGAGADRLSSGMTRSFGVTMGRAAIINPGKEIFFVSCKTDKAARAARDALTMIKSKIPCRSRIVFTKVK